MEDAYTSFSIQNIKQESEIFHKENNAGLVLE
jgi:hypothetical protein